MCKKIVVRLNIIEKFDDLMQQSKQFLMFWKNLVLGGLHNTAQFNIQSQCPVLLTAVVL